MVKTSKIEPRFIAESIMQNKAKKVLFINRHAPHGDSCAQEALDVLLMASTFAQHLTVLFLDEGVWQLKAQQDTQLLGTKNFSATYKALSLYDIEKVYAEKESLETRRLTGSDLIIPVSLLNAREVADLMARQDSILSF
jgi:tRNA 2-thiouridine synthesizing protein C